MSTPEKVTLTSIDMERMLALNQQVRKAGHRLNVLPEVRRTDIPAPPAAALRDDIPPGHVMVVDILTNTTRVVPEDDWEHERQTACLLHPDPKDEEAIEELYVDDPSAALKARKLGVRDVHFFY